MSGPFTLLVSRWPSTWRDGPRRPTFPQMLSASRSISGAAASSWPISSGVNPAASARAKWRDPRTALVAERGSARLGNRHHRTPAVGRVGLAVDQATRFQRAQRRAHRLHADLLGPGQCGHRGRAAALQLPQRRGFRQRQLARHLHLLKAPLEQAHAQVHGRGHVFDFRFRVHMPRLTLQVQYCKSDLTNSVVRLA